MRIFPILSALILLTAGASFGASQQDRGWGSSWTVPHSAEEKEARDLDKRMRTALQAEDWPTVGKLLKEGQHLNPNSMQLNYATALVAMKRQHYSEATAAFSRMLTLPRARESSRISSEIYTERSYVNALQGSYQTARADLERAIGLDRTNLKAHNNYAWLLATCPESSVRDGRRALSFARELSKKLNANSPMALDTLAAAQAETGDYRDAIKTQERAISAAGNTKLSVYREHLQSYQRGQAVHVAPDRPKITINSKF